MSAAGKPGVNCSRYGMGSGVCACGGGECGMMAAARGGVRKLSSQTIGAIMSWEQRMDESGLREGEALAIQLMKAEIAEHRAAAEKPLGPTIAELQAVGDLQAFPRPGIDGMTLRDYFAAKCSAAMVSTIRDDRDYDRLRTLAAGHELDSVSQFIARESYKQADAMLAARGAA